MASAASTVIVSVVRVVVPLGAEAFAVSVTVIVPLLVLPVTLEPPLSQVKVVTPPFAAQEIPVGKPVPVRVV
jgi:hypothetical protein